MNKNNDEGKKGETNEGDQSNQQKKDKPEKKWKQKFIQIWQLNEQMQRNQAEVNEKSIGPENFVPIMKLGQGSFGQVYLVEKVVINKDGTQTMTGKWYAMKILNKK